MNKNYALIMLACCLIPIAGLAAIFVLGVPVNIVVLAGLALFCPLAHLLLMKFLPHAHSESSDSTGRPKPLPEKRAG